MLPKLARHIDTCSALSVWVGINEHTIACLNGFPTFGAFVNHIQNQVLPYCPNANVFNFNVNAFPNPVNPTLSITNSVLTTLLNSPQINRATYVRLQLLERNETTQIPIKPIVEWLHRKRGPRNQKALILDCNLSANVLNFDEMLTHFKMVSVFVHISACVCKTRISSHF